MVLVYTCNHECHPTAYILNEQLEAQDILEVPNANSVGQSVTKDDTSAKRNQYKRTCANCHRMRVAGTSSSRERT